MSRDRRCTLVCIVWTLIAASVASAQESVVKRNAAGQIVETYTLVDDKPDGAYASFHEGGAKSEGNYVKGNLVGKWLEYHANGKVHRDVSFADGQLTGVWSQCDDTGQLAIQGETYGCAYHANDDRSPLRTGLWVSYDASGNITGASLFERNQLVGQASYATDPTTGITRVSVPGPDGSPSAVEIDKNGRIGGPEAPKPETPGPEDAADLVAMQEDAATGEIRTVRRNEDGSTTSYAGVRHVDPDGTERLVETDEEGNRIESVFSPDGTVTVTKSSPGEGETKTTTTKDGRVSTVHRDVTGETQTSSLAEDGSIATERRDAKGELIETIRDLPDGWTEHVDARGNSRMVLRDSDGSTTTIMTDRSGNSTTTVVDSGGAVVLRESDRVAPREPGRDYFEQVLNGTDWDDLPDHLRSRYADSERTMREIEARRAEEDAAEARQKAEAARIAAENLAASEETKRRFDALRAEQEEADRIAAQRRARVERQAEIDKSYETARQLQRQYDDAVERGDKAEAMRVLALQDEHHERSMEVLQHTPEESEAMQRYSDARSRLANDITARAYTAAKERMASDQSMQETKENVTTVTRFVSFGSKMQQATKQTTRGANREKVLAQTKQEEIARMLADPATTAEQRAILEDIQSVAIVPESGAAELLAANSRITAAGYVVDAALVLTGGKVVQAGSGVVRSAAGAVSGVLARRAGAAAGSTTAGAGRTTVTLVAEDAGRTLGLTSRMTVAERQALLESRASASMGEVTRIVGRDVLPGPAAPRATLEITRSELARLHTPGANLTRTEIIRKAEVYRAMESARAGLRRAINEGAPESAVAPLQATFQRLNGLIEEAKSTAWATWRGG